MYTDCMYVVLEDSRKNSYKTTTPNGARGFHRDTNKKKDAYGIGRLVCPFFFFSFFLPHPYSCFGIKSSACAWDKIFL